MLLIEKCKPAFSMTGIGAVMDLTLLSPKLVSVQFTASLLLATIRSPGRAVAGRAIFLSILPLQ